VANDDKARRARVTIESAIGAALVPVGRGQTYRTPSGKLVHLRSSKMHAHRPGWANYWFGIQENRWYPEDFFALVCGDEGILIVPVSEWLTFRERLGLSGEDRKVNIWRSGHRYTLQVGDDRPDITNWLDRFELLSG
jgi:hypothetical protein